MVRTFASLDYTPWVRSGLVPAMVTLTLPADWLPVAPDGVAFKRLVAVFRRRYERAWGTPLACLWKLEFQRRGAAHLHMWMPVPHGLAGEWREAVNVRHRLAVGDGLLFRHWLSAVWAAVVAHPDPEERRKHLLAGTAVDYKEGLRAIDPRRLAVYFAKHGTYRVKDYQNDPPPEWCQPGKGPGRFWGYWGLRPAVVEVEVTPGQWTALARAVRRYAHAQGVTHQAQVIRTRGGRASPVTREVVGLAGAQLLAARRPRRRKVRRRVTRLASGRGFLCVNDAPRLATALARVIERE
jgi:hypothetical protein